jgi:hypothetical protein
MKCEMRKPPSTGGFRLSVCEECRVKAGQIAGWVAGIAVLVFSQGAVAQTSGASLGSSQRTSAQPSSLVADAAAHANWDLGALVQGGFGLTEDRGGFKFLLAGGHAGRILTPQVGSGLLKGDFEYGVEVFPFWQSYTPKIQRANCYPAATPGAPVPIEPGLYCTALYEVGGTYTGASITPIILRWNFTHGERWMPWVQGAGGLIWTNHKYPPFGSTILNLNNDGPNADTSVWNFTPQFGVGAHYFVRPRRSIDMSANAVHISSASLGDKNPGVNVSVQFSVGYSWWK